MSAGDDIVRLCICVGAVAFAMAVAVLANHLSGQNLRYRLERFFSNVRKEKRGLLGMLLDEPRITFDFRGMKGWVNWKARIRYSSGLFRMFLFYPNRGEGQGFKLDVERGSIFGQLLMLEPSESELTSFRNRCHLQTINPAFSGLLDMPGVLLPLEALNRYVGRYSITFGPKGLYLNFECFPGHEGLELAIAVCLLLYRRTGAVVHEAGLELPESHLDFDRPFLPPDISPKLKARIPSATGDVDVSRENYFMGDEKFQTSGLFLSDPRYRGDASPMVRTMPAAVGDDILGPTEGQDYCGHCRSYVSSVDAECCPRCGAVYHRDCMGTLDMCWKCGCELRG